MVENGASPAIANDKNYVPLDLASFGDKFEVVDYFLAQSGGIEGQNEEGLGGAAQDIKLDDGEEGEEEAEQEDTVTSGKSQ